MNFYAISALINLITGACLCLAILSKEKRNKIDLAFTLFAFSACIWSLGYFLWQISSNDGTALFWSRFLIAGAIGIAVSYTHFVFEFLDVSKAKKQFLFIVDIFFAMFFLLNLTPLMVSKVSPRLNFSYWPIPGLAFHFYLALWVICIVYSTYLIYRKYIISEGNTRNQFKFLFAAVFIGFIAGSMNYLLWYNIPIPPVTNVFVSLYFILVFYSIIKYQLFNIRVITTELFVLVLIGAAIWQLISPEIAQNIFIATAYIFLVMLAGIFLIRTVMHEVSQKESLQSLSTQLAEANEKLVSLDKARAEFISIASHQLRTPPATIKWYLAAVIAGDFGRINPKALKALMKTEYVNNNLILLIDDLLNVSRIERGKMEFLFETTDVEELTQAVVDQLEPQILTKTIKMLYAKPKKHLPKLIADKEKLMQVFNNLIDNAIKYTKKGKIYVRLWQTKTDILFSVADNGKGMNDVERQEIFAKYKRGKDSMHAASGLGLGLYVAKIVVEHHHGKIWAESPGEGQGSTFFVSLPIKTDLTDETEHDLTSEK